MIAIMNPLSIQNVAPPSLMLMAAHMCFVKLSMSCICFMEGLDPV